MTNANYYVADIEVPINICGNGGGLSSGFTARTKDLGLEVELLDFAGPNGFPLYRIKGSDPAVVLKIVKEYEQ